MLFLQFAARVMIANKLKLARSIRGQFVVCCRAPKVVLSFSWQAIFGKVDVTRAGLQ